MIDGCPNPELVTLRPKRFRTSGTAYECSSSVSDWNVRFWGIFSERQVSNPDA